MSPDRVSQGLNDQLEQLVDMSHGLTRACVLQDCLTPDLVSIEDIRRMLENLRGHPDREMLLRVFVGARQCFRSEREVFASPPDRGEDLETWGNRLLGPERWGCTLYRAEQLNTDLVERLAGPWAQLNGGPASRRTAQEIFVFFGNYGDTPFGIHQDREQGAAVHFHLGPGLKRMYLWSPETFEAATGGRATFYDRAAIEDSADIYDIPAGSVFVLPPGWFHVGETRDFSAGVVVTNVALSQSRMRERALQTFLDAVDPDDGDDVAKMAATPVADALEAGMQEMGDLLESNAGFSPGPHTGPDPGSPGPDTRYARHPDFPIVLRTSPPDGSGTTMSLFVRGRKMVMPESDALTGLVQALNDGTSITWGGMIARLEEEFEPEAAEFVCRQFLDLGALSGPASE